MKKLLITRPMPDSVLARAQAGFDTTVRQSNRPLQGAELRQSLRNFDVVMPTLGDVYDHDVFADVGAPRCQLLANFGVGYNHIDVDAATAAGIMVTNTPGAVTEATADIALMLMLMSARRAGEGERMVRAGKWEGWHPTQMMGLHLSGKAVGVVGMGRIGQAIAHRCHFGFGMRVKYYNRSIKQIGFDAKRYESLNELASNVDFLVAAVPGGAATHHVINARVFAALPSHARFINISRGDVVDEVALIEALKNGVIEGAGLDVYENEPKVPAELIKMENVVLLPHLGTAALEIRTQMGLMAVENLEAFDRSLPLPNRI